MPRRVGRYEVLREIGEGGMATVHLARQTDLDRLVALKELAALRSSDPQVARRFARESRLMGSLAHPNIVTVFDYLEDRGTPFIAMEYLERGSLRPWVGRLTLAQVAGILEGLLAALEHAERHEVVHRDLKPENVLVSGDGRVKIADFGIARTVSSVTALTQTGMTIGTPAYMAPEQALGRPVGPWTDLYSLGVMTFELLLGQVPFADTGTSVGILLRHVNEDVPPLHDVDPAIDAGVSAWVSRLVAKEPEARPAGAASAWDAFEDLVLDRLGPRWRREAALPERPPAEAPAAAATAPPGGTVPAAIASAGAAPTLAPRSEVLALGAPAVAAAGSVPAAGTPTIAPLSQHMAGVASTPDRRGRLMRALLVAALVALAIAALAATVQRGVQRAADPAGAPARAPAHQRDGEPGGSRSDDPSDDREGGSDGA